MDKINRFRKTQTLTPDSFIDNVLEHPSCRYCQYYEDCKEAIGEDNMEYDIGLYGCTAFDNSVEALEKIYKKEYC